jgi:hypothetical protein
MYEYQASIDDVTGTDFKAARARGQVINNPCDNVKTTIVRQGGGKYNAYQLPAGTLRYFTTGAGSLTNFLQQLGYNPGLLDIPSEVDENIITSARIKAMSNVDKAPYSVAEDIATIRETVRFVRNPLQALDELTQAFTRTRRVLTGVRRIDKKLRPGRVKALANLELTYRFAASPLVRSISTVLQGLMDGGNTDYTKIHRAHGYAGPVKDSVKGNVTATPFVYKRTASVTTEAWSTVYYSVSPPLREWQKKYGLRIKDVPELVWDLFPLSFMYDRVADIGGAIRGFTNLSDPNVTIIGGVSSSKSIKTQTISAIAQNSSAYDVVISPDTDSYRTESYSRAPWQPTVTDLIPPAMPSGLISDATKMADLAALIIQRLL